jgi:hypothetical protein
LLQTQDVAKGMPLATSCVCSNWCASSISALRPWSGAAPACDARPLTSIVAVAVPAAASSTASAFSTALAGLGS